MRKEIKILYVEDEQGIRENTKRPLKYLCDELLVACNGQEGLELYQQHFPDIVVSDIKMPKMNGIEMCKEIKKINENQHIVFTTAHSESDYFMDAIEMQVDGYILKPIDYDLLEKKIEKIIQEISIKHKVQQQEKLIHEITQLQDNVLLVLNFERKVIYSNQKFLKFFNVKTTTEFNNKYKNIGDLFVKNNNFFYPKESKDWINDLKRTKDEKRRVVSIINEDNEAHAFLISLKCIEDSAHATLILTEITNITIEKNHYEEKAYIDELTKIHNRAYFEKAFKKEIIKCENENTPLSFIILDIDKFKDFNDNYGHQMGDEILKDLAKIINKNTRQTDVFARWGGEEFVKVLSNTSLKDATKVAENLRKIVEEYIFKNSLRVTCSFGVAMFNQNDTKESVMKRADDALYMAKKNGRNRVEIESKI
ncbi:MAG: diguanylate cyclase [Campylobacterota bacterium]|nr:diguanylate cyclase [Campylobacterota bacterium]